MDVELQIQGLTAVICGVSTVIGRICMPNSCIAQGLTVHSHHLFFNCFMWISLTFTSRLKHFKNMQCQAYNRYVRHTIQLEEKPSCGSKSKDSWNNWIEPRNNPNNCVYGFVWKKLRWGEGTRSRQCKGNSLIFSSLTSCCCSDRSQTHKAHWLSWLNHSVNNQSESR